MVLQALQKKNFEAPDKTQNPPNSKIDTINMGDKTVLRYTFLPGWRWSKDSKPIVGTKSCQVHHFGVFVSGRLHVKTDDGQETEFGPGDVADIQPGHDGWVIGNESAVYYEFAVKSASK